MCYLNTSQLSRVALASAQAEGFLPETPRIFRHESRAPELWEENRAHQLASAISELEGELLTPRLPAPTYPEQERIRRDKLSKLREAGMEPYPPAVPRTVSIRDLRTQTEIHGEHSVVGRVLRIRNHGGVVFADLREELAEIQIIFSADRPESNLSLWKSLVDRGDQVSVTGQLTRSRSGELSLHASAWHMAANCLIPPPDKFRGLVDSEAKVRNRHIDLALNSAATRIRARSAVAHAVHEVLADRRWRRPRGDGNRSRVPSRARVWPRSHRRRHRVGRRAR